MIKEFKANPEEKTRLTKLRRSDDEKIAYLKKGKKITGIFVVAAPILMLLFGFIFPALFAMETEDGGYKNIIVIIFLASAVFMISLCIHIIARILQYNISGFNIINRLQESLFLDGTELEFGYRLRDSTYTGDRAIYHFNMLSLSKIVYDSKFKRLNMWGQYHHTYYINYLERRIETDSDVDTEKPFELYLYFEPDLLAELQSRGVPIEVV